AALPVEPSAPDVDLAELLAAGVDVELEATAGFRELRDIEVRVDGVLPFDVYRFRSLAHLTVPPGLGFAWTAPSTDVCNEAGIARIWLGKRAASGTRLGSECRPRR